MSSDSDYTAFVKFGKQTYNRIAEYAETKRLTIEEAIRRGMHTFLNNNIYYIEQGYFEAHITFQPVNGIGWQGHELETVQKLLEHHKFKYSYITNDPVLGNKAFAYGTAYSESLTDLVDKMYELKCKAEDLNLDPCRRKVERIVYDTKKMGNNGYLFHEASLNLYHKEHY
jgi:hypothetical protein